MKKIDKLKMTVYMALAAFAWSTCAQAASDSSTQVVDYPFARMRVQLQAQASVWTPPLVGPQHFKNNLADDCQKFEESYNQYAVNVDDFSRYLANSSRELSLGYTMKPQYELYMAVELLNSAKPTSSEQWMLDTTDSSLRFDESSMMSISKNIGLEQKNAELYLKGSNLFVLRGRDVACDLLSGRARLSTAINVEVQADENDVVQARQVAQLWLDQVQELEKTNLSDRQKAAWLGFQFENLKARVETEKLNEYMNVHYFFETFFQPNQILLWPEWKSDISQKWRKKIKVVLPVGVEHL